MTHRIASPWRKPKSYLVSQRESWSSQSISKWELVAVPFYDPTTSRYDSIKYLLKMSALTLRSSGKGLFVVWHSFSFTLEENSSWKFPYADLLLYRFMSTVSFLTIFKTHALSQVISPRSNAAIAWFMDYGDCAKLYKQVWHFYLVKVIVPVHIKWQDSPTGLRFFCCSQW